MPSIDPLSLQVYLSENQYLPDEGPKLSPLVLDFSTAPQFTLDLLLPQQLTRSLSMLQTLYIDMSHAASSFSVTVLTTGQVITAKTNTQGYYTITAPNPIRLTFDCADATAVVKVLLLNVAIPGSVWQIS